MKIRLLTLLCIPFFTYGQWINSSCSKKAKPIVELAIEYGLNLEQQMAIGAANAALKIDKNCGCAKLVLAAMSSGRSWGTRSKKLDQIAYAELSKEEQAWFTLLKSSNEDYDETASMIKSKFPNSPLLQFLVIKPQTWDAYPGFVEQFPEYASAAYNMMSYGYMGDGYGDSNFEQAMAMTDKSMSLHEGPNILDSKAEHFAANGNYEKALEYQLKAVDFGSFVSPYWESATLYWRNMNADTIKVNLKEKMKTSQNAILERDIEEFKKYIHSKFEMITGDSNLKEFYSFNDEQFDIEPVITWESFDLYNMDVALTPDIKTAVLTFYAKGSYFLNEKPEEKVPYSTRASSVWIASDEGWKMIHANWAPFNDGIGIPK